MADVDARLSWPAVAVSIFVAFALAIVVLPDAVAPLRPALVPMVAFYWIMHFPDRFGILLGCSLGLMLDVLTGSLLGSHVLALVLPCYCVARMARIFRFSPLWQQALMLLPLWALYAFVLFWIDGATGRNADALLRFGPLITTVLCWPLLAIILGTMVRQSVDD
ncbi:rod shape-determining protein MreD [bacterium]|nr:rod shape-determining protein MreD [bacterium]